ncbi:uncharacterized protein LOC117579098 [Drosophila guanche]|uniref:uncharacterized protein LOC117579098 n=1 Tax=Drosophila guanche TaxID=7266 RepID=UPI001471DAD6|nr:uncharacterized protein LOC117579098 [Drosophila guanche]
MESFEILYAKESIRLSTQTSSSQDCNPCKMEYLKAFRLRNDIVFEIPLSRTRTIRSISKSIRHSETTSDMYSKFRNRLASTTTLGSKIRLHMKNSIFWPPKTVLKIAPETARNARKSIIWICG